MEKSGCKLNILKCCLYFNGKEPKTANTPENVIHSSVGQTGLSLLSKRAAVNVRSVSTHTYILSVTHTSRISEEYLLEFAPRQSSNRLRLATCGLVNP